jgi:hypothetical protein
MTVGSAIVTEEELVKVEFVHLCPEKALKLGSQKAESRPS